MTNLSKLLAGLAIFSSFFTLMYAWGVFGGVLAIGYQERKAKLISAESVYEKMLGTTTVGRSYLQISISYEFEEEKKLCIGTRLRMTGNGVSNLAVTNRLVEEMTQQSRKDQFRIYAKGQGSCDSVVFRYNEDSVLIKFALSAFLATSAWVMYFKKRRW